MATTGMATQCRALATAYLMAAHCWLLMSFMVSHTKNSPKPKKNRYCKTVRKVGCMDANVVRRDRKVSKVGKDGCPKSEVRCRKKEVRRMEDGSLMAGLKK